ncbi:DUF397 domain-containing protein [Streptomyces harbinensis]|uniref:DUF397 domain-containing protein n=1 Tax=Streptomyces harbinensis TaxID=1176198 RepID=A0A1I6W064_9ACTN|nr:DUF397 domain-containing protein [Streptomyces harbinensis]SFT19353.1 protein of unknown function [Streptomyces harbinensis]
MTALTFRKSSYSNGTPEGACVEVAIITRAGVAIRDSKDPNGPVLRLSPAAWTAFLATAPTARR